MATVETEGRLLKVGRQGTAEHAERIVRGWRRLDRKLEARESARQHASRALHVYRDEDGTEVLRGRLTPEVGELLLRAVDAGRETPYQRGREESTIDATVDLAEAPPTIAQQRADALALLAETALHDVELLANSAEDRRSRAALPRAERLAAPRHFHRRLGP